MKTLLWRFGFLLPAALFAVYVLMAVFGVVTSLIGVTPLFYCTVFCKVGVAIVIAAVAAVFLTHPSSYVNKA